MAPTIARLLIPMCSTTARRRVLLEVNVWSVVANVQSGVGCGTRAVRRASGDTEDSRNPFPQVIPWPRLQRERGLKEMIYRSREMSIDDGLRLSALMGPLARDTEDAKEGLKAFSEKRAPDFRGR